MQCATCNLRKQEGSNVCPQGLLNTRKSLQIIELQNNPCMYVLYDRMYIQERKKVGKIKLYYDDDDDIRAFIINSTTGRNE